jgi:hypothetical protein
MMDVEAHILRQALLPFTTCFASSSTVTLRLEGTRLVVSKASCSMSHALRISAALARPPLDTCAVALRVPIGKLATALAAFDDAAVLQLSASATILRLQCEDFCVDLLGREYDRDCRCDDADMAKLFTGELQTIHVDVVKLSRFAALADGLRLQDAVLAVTTSDFTIRCKRNADGTENEQASLTMPRSSGLASELASGLVSGQLVVSTSLLADLISAAARMAPNATIGLATWGLRITWGDLAEAALMTTR